MRRALSAVVALATVAMIASMAVGTHAGADGRPTQYIVLYEANASPSAVKAAVRAAKGRILKANNKVGVATVISSNARFRTDAARFAAIKSVARNIPIGRADPKLRLKQTIEASRLKAKLAPQQRSATTFQGNDDDDPLQPEPLAHLQWDMRMIHATVDGSYKKHKGSKRVLVGILDTGIDGSHPDIAPNFNRALSRNFTTDIPLVDGPCAEEPDASCNDPNDVDENLHGTHVASSVASPINRLGIAGVAPGVTLVNLRAGQDSGFFFLQASVDALTYAGDHGIDVANMSYFIDPWLYNCGNPLHPVPEDSPADRAEQKTIIEATQRALDYAHLHGVTLVAALGNGNTDISVPAFDGQSPNFPPNNEHDRTVNNTCLDLPTEGNNVISVSALGPSKRKADYSNWSYEETTVAAPGGWFRDEGWTPANPAGGIPNLVLGALPKNVAEELHLINPDGTPANPQVLRDCRGSTCAYYIYIQGTSMASPHATGVAALIVSKYGDRRRGGISLHPLFTQAYLEGSATDTGCELMRNRPDGTFSYEAFGTPTSPRGANYTTYCEGTPVYNGVYGHGIVDALGAVTFGDHTGGDHDDE
jgi:lantibiotic leader peptide-processing serine protease